jgi:hypothetical protein
MSASPVGIDESEDLAYRLLQNGWRQIADAPCLSPTPVKALDLIGQYYPLDAEPCREQHLEGVSLHLRRDGAPEGHPHAAVV